TIHTADCLPILGYSDSIIGACHGGWRGISKKIIENFISKMMSLGASADSIKINIGPGIGPCHFEVGNDVAQTLCEFDQTVSLPHKDPEKKFIDLKKLAVLR